jgi:hypothetical protein
MGSEAAVQRLPADGRLMAHTLTEDSRSPAVARLPTTGPGGVRAGLHRLAGRAYPVGSAGQATRGAKADPALT